MLITLSPSKGQDFEQAAPTQTYTIPTQLSDSEVLIKQLKTFSKKDIGELMSISENLSDLNVQRFQSFSTPFDPQNAKQALFAFKGDVYSGINTASMNQADYDYAQEHLRILSGLYGSLKPLDLIQPYRLEMKTKLVTKSADNLYQYWGDSITDELNRSLENQKEKVVVNLASQEYWKSVKPKYLDGKVINVAFKENKDGKSRIIAIFAKKARGMMADFLIRNRVETVQGIKDFNSHGYKYDAEVSTESLLVFSRQQPKPVTKQTKKSKNKLCMNNNKFKIPATSREVTKTEISYYQKHGAVKLSNVFSEQWIDYLRAATDTAMKNPGPHAEEYAKGGGKFFGDLDVAKRFAPFKDFIYHSGAAQLMAAIMQSNKINFFYDQLLVKEPGTNTLTPWHQDQPYWAVAGKQIASIWLPLDVVDKDTSLRYVSGSHLWEAFNPHNFTDNSPYKGTGLPELPDIDAHPEKYDLLGWDMQPGDCLVFQGMIVHGAKGNSSNNRRRAWATRWTGDDVTYDKRSGQVAIPTDDPGLSHGESLDSEAFPVIWQT